MSKVLVDTNIFLDVIFARHQPSGEFFKVVQFASVGLCVSLKTVMDFSHFAKTAYSKEKINSTLADIMAMYEFLPTTRQNILDALSSQFSDFEDAIQYHTALSDPEVEAIITRNKRDYRNSKLPVYAPEEYIKLLEKKE